MSIRLDRAVNSVVVRCTDCPSWRALSNDPIEGARIGARHASSVHDTTRANDALTAAIRRRRSVD